MIVFCHLLNDNSGSPRVLSSTIDALDAPCDGLLYVGSQGRGVLESNEVQTRRYWYRRSSYRIVTLFNYLASQLVLYRALVRTPDIPPDAVIFVNTLLPFAAMLWGRRNGRRVIVHVHEISITPAPLRWFLCKCASGCSDLLLYVSRDHLSRLPIEGPPAKVMFNPVDPLLRSRAEKIDNLPHRSDVFEVLMLASLRGYKGIEEFMTLASAMRSRNDIHFTLVLNAEPSEVATLAEQHPNLENVTLHARTEDPASFYATADLLLNLSRIDQWIETFGLTLIEAMTFGIPVIAPSIGGPTEIVTDGIEGYCIDSRNLTELKSAVLRLADDPETYAAMSKAARSRAGDFTFDKYAKALRAALAETEERATQ